MSPQYVYMLWAMGEQAVFTWPACAKKYIRDTYTVDGELHLPPPELIILTKFKVNPKAGGKSHHQQLNIEAFVAG